MRAVPRISVGERAVAPPSNRPGNGLDSTNGRRFIDGDVSIGDILPNLPSEIYALVRNGKYRKYIYRIFYISFVKITPNVR